MNKILNKSIRYTIRTLNALSEGDLSIENIRIRNRLRKMSINYNRYKLFDKKWLLDSNINTVIDIGANIGEFTFIFSELFPNAYIYAFEPLPDCFNQLEKRTKNMRNIKIFNFALGSTEGELKLHKSSWHPASSFREMGDLHKQNYPHSSESDDLIVRIKKLDDIFKKESLTNNIFIKMDVQGFEDEVIKGGPNIFKNAKVVVVESSYQKLYDNEPLFDGIYSLLKPLGFEFRGSLKQSVSKSDESFLQADCIFIKRNNNV